MTAATAPERQAMTLASSKAHQFESVTAGPLEQPALPATRWRIRDAYV